MGTDFRPAITREARQNQLIALAENTAEEMMRSGKVSSQIITHYLKMGSIEKEIELEKLRHENELLQAKTESIRMAQRSEELMERALAEFRRYSGNDLNEEVIDDEFVG